MRGLITLAVVLPVLVVFGAYLLPFVLLLMLVGLFGGFGRGGGNLKSHQAKW